MSRICWGVTYANGVLSEPYQDQLRPDNWPTRVQPVWTGYRLYVFADGFPTPLDALKAVLPYVALRNPAEVLAPPIRGARP